MAFAVALNDVIKMRIVCKATPQTSYNVLYYRISSVIGAPTDATLGVGILAAGLVAAMKDVISNDATYSAFGLQKMSTPPSVETIVTSGTGVGTGGAGLAPLAVSGIITKRTNAAGRAYRGRMYTPFVPVGYVGADGHPGFGWVSSLNVLGAILFNPIVCTSGADTATMQPVIRQAIAPHALTDITATTAQPRFGTQHRRGDYGQQNP